MNDLGHFDSTHLVSQYADRCSFWSLRDLSGDVAARMLCVTTDGADQALVFSESFHGWCMA